MGSAYHRERGNGLFKRGRYSEAIQAYLIAEENKENCWHLAVSNRAICHLKLNEYSKAVEAADVCLQQEEVSYKAFTKFKALMATDRRNDAFEVLRLLKELPDLPSAVAAAAAHEEAVARQEHEEVESAAAQESRADAAT